MAKKHLSTKPYKFADQDKLFKATSSRQIIQGTVSGDVRDLAELEKRVRSILISAGKPSRISQVSKDYRVLFGEEFPTWELGVPDVVSVFKKIPAACEILNESENDPLVRVKITGKNAHIFDLVKKSKSTPKPIKEDTSLRIKRDVFVPFNVQDGIRRILFKRKSIKIDEFYKILKEEYDLKVLKLVNVPVEELVQSLPHILYHDKGYVKRAYNITKSEIEIPEYLHFKEELIIPSYRLSIHEIEVGQNLLQLLQKKEFLPVRDIPQLYAKTFGKDLNWFRFGFQDLRTFLQLIPGDFSLVFSDEGFKVVLPYLVHPDENDIRAVEAIRYCGKPVFTEILHKIEQLILQKNNGLNVKYLVSSYETLYYEKLVIRGDIHEFLDTLQKCNVLTVRKDGNDTLLFPTCIALLQEDIHLAEEESESKQIEYPKDVLQPGEALTTVDFAENINPQKQEFCGGYVTDIESPNNFFIRLLGVGKTFKRSFKEEYTQMMQEMQTFYTAYSEKYCITDKHLRSDMVCASCVKGHWHRSQIMDFISSSRLRVKLLDEGSNHLVTLLNLRYLKREFARLPALACCATLFNIQSNEPDWSLQAIMKFRQLTWVSPLKARELSILIIHRNKNGHLQVVLSAVLDNKEIHIGDELVELGLAKFKLQDKKLIGFYS